jgi:shikimate kinase
MSLSRPRAVFIGAPASGKSKVAKRVARILDVARFDTDKMVVAEHGPIAEIFDTAGESVFREYERAAVSEAFRHDGVVSLGGGAVLNLETRAELTELPVVLLTVSEEAVAERIGDPKRPLLRDGIDAWKALVAARQPIYDSLARIRFDTSERSLDEIAADVAEWIRAGYPEGGSRE